MQHVFTGANTSMLAEDPSAQEMQEKLHKITREYLEWPGSLFAKARHSRSYYSLAYIISRKIDMPCTQLFPIYSRINENRIRLQSDCLRTVRELCKSL